VAKRGEQVAEKPAAFEILACSSSSEWGSGLTMITKRVQTLRASAIDYNEFVIAFFD